MLLVEVSDEDSELGYDLDIFDSKDDDEDDNAIDGGAFAPQSRRPNAHGGLRARRVSPLEVYAYACMMLISR